MAWLYSFLCAVGSVGLVALWVYLCQKYPSFMDTFICFLFGLGLVAVFSFMFYSLVFS